MGNFKILMIFGILGLSMAMFQNCSQSEFSVREADPTVTTQASITPAAVPEEEVECEAEVCGLPPLTDKAAVTTILLALGDQVNERQIINNVSNRVLVENIVRYSSPKQNPKVLIVRARDRNGEDLEDSDYIADLLSVYNTTVRDEPASGLTADMVKNFDLVWFNNPGHPFSIKQSLDTLLNYNGSIVLQGDDLARGVGFKMDALTGLNYIDNGTEVVCDDEVSYNHNDNDGHQFRVSFTTDAAQVFNQQAVNFRYGNDIDNTSIVGENVETIATAKGGPETCTRSRPAIVRHFR